MHTASPQPADFKPIPPRYWWLKRISLVAAAFALFLITLRLWWGWEANRQLQAEIDKIIAAGEPIYPEDFDPKESIPDDQNAAKCYLQAGNGLTYPVSTVIYNLPDDAWALGDRRDDVAALLRVHAAELDEVRAARNRRKVNWPIVYASPVIETLLPALGEQNAMSKLLCLAAGYHHTNGDDLNAVQTILDALVHLGAMEEHPFLIVHMETSRNMMRLCRAIESVAPFLAVSVGSSPRADHAGASSATDVRAIIAALLDEKASEAALVRSLLEERMSELDAVSQVLRGRISAAHVIGIFGESGSYWDPVESYLFCPAFAFDGVVMMRAASSMVAAADERTYPAANLKMQSIVRQSGSPGALYNYAHPLSTRMMISIDSSVLRTHFQAIAMRRMAATRLAIRLFEVERGGVPKSLEELVPAYLTAVTRDPFARDDRQVSYSPDATPPILYCVGLNGVDDGGHYEQRADRLDDQKLDVPFFLNGDDRRGRTSKE